MNIQVSVYEDEDAFVQTQLYLKWGKLVTALFYLHW